jgi:TonB family protein
MKGAGCSALHPNMKTRIVLTTVSVTLLTLAMFQTSPAQSSNQAKQPRNANEYEPTARMGMYYAVMCELSSAAGQRTQAREYAEKAISLLENPSDDFEFYAKGVAYEELVNYDLALANLDKAIQYDDQKVIAYIRRSRVYSRKGNFDRALADLDKAIQLEAENSAGPPPDKGNMDPSNKELQELIQLDPRPWFDYLRPGGVYLERGKVYLQIDDNDRAIADFTKVIQLDPEGADAYNHRGVAYGNKDDFVRAIADFDTAIQLNPVLRNAYNNRGLAYSRIGDEARARAEFEKEKELYPHDKFESVSQNGGVLNGHAVKLAKPKYPKAARKARASGLVVVQVLIDEKGKVIGAHVIRGDSLLHDVAVEAAKNSLFTPTLLAGQPVKVTGVIHYNFVAR